MAQRYLTAPQVAYREDSRSVRKYDTCEQETNISRLGEIVELSANMPLYATCHTSVLVTGQKGSDPGKLYRPTGVAIHEETHQIFIANSDNDRVDIFSETGELLYQLGVEKLYHPYGIALHGDSVYVSCEDHTVSKFSLTEMCRVKRIGGWRSNNVRFSDPRQLTTDPIGCVFIVDQGNDRICIHDPDLNHLRNIMLQSMSQPNDVKVSRDRLYVLCPYDSPCVHVLTLEGDKLHSFITCCEGMDVLEPWFFCFDPLNNFVLSDSRSHIFRVFSQEGNLLHTMGEERHNPGTFEYPCRVAMTPNARLVCVSDNESCGLRIYY